MQTAVAHPLDFLLSSSRSSIVMPGLHKCDALRLRYTKTSFCISFASFASDRAPPIPTITLSLRHPRAGEDPLASVKSAP